MHCVFSFKKIRLEDSYISQNLRLLNLTANNGLILMATIYDEGKGHYVGKTYEKKGLFVNWEMSIGELSCL